MHASARNSGFTLVELSIVLVIIGLVVAGVMVGRDLVLTAEARSVMSQFDRYDAAIQAFRGKYNCLPGDCYNATMFGLGANGNNNGAIDGMLDGAVSQTFVSTGGNGQLRFSTAYGAEGNAFWIHLSTAQMIPDTISTCTIDCFPGTNLPKLVNGKGGVVIATWAGKTFYVTGQSGTSTASGQIITAMKTPAVAGQQARFMMAKFDIPSVTSNGNGDKTFPLALNKGDRVVPLSGDSGDYNLVSDASSTGYSSQNPPCVTGSPPRISDTGNCNVLWRVQGW